MNTGYVRLHMSQARPPVLFFRHMMTFSLERFAKIGKELGIL